MSTSTRTAETVTTRARKVPLPEKARGLTIDGGKPTALQVEGLDTPLEHIQRDITMVHGKLHDRGMSLLGQVLLKERELKGVFDDIEWAQLEKALAKFGLKRGMKVLGWGNAGFDMHAEVR